MITRPGVMSLEIWHRWRSEAVGDPCSRAGGEGVLLGPVIWKEVSQLANVKKIRVYLNLFLAKKNLVHIFLSLTFLTLDAP